MPRRDTGWRHDNDIILLQDGRGWDGHRATSHRTSEPAREAGRHGGAFQGLMQRADAMEFA
jgi:hypothetical protein